MIERYRAPAGRPNDRVTQRRYRKTLAGACSFESNDVGYEKFKQYLESSAKTPTCMMLDVIEEDFRKDKKDWTGRYVDKRSFGKLF